MKDKIINLIKQIVTGNKVKEVHLGSKLYEELGFDSMMAIRLLLSLEEECGLNLEEADIDLAQIETVADVVNVVEENL